MNRSLISLSNLLTKYGRLEEADYIDELLKFKDKEEWSIDHESILDLARSEAPSKEFVAPIESIHQINAMLLQYREELKSKLLRMIGKHRRRGELETPMVLNTMKNLIDIIYSIESSIDSNKKESKNFNTEE